MTTISQGLRDKIEAAGKAKTPEAFEEMAKQAFAEGHKYAIEAGMFNIGFIFKYLMIKGTGVEKDNVKQAFGIDFFEVGLGAGISGGYVWGVLDDLPAGTVSFAKFTPMYWVGGGFIEVYQGDTRAADKYFGTLGIFGGGDAIDLISVGIGKLHKS